MAFLENSSQLNSLTVSILQKDSSGWPTHGCRVCHSRVAAVRTCKALKLIADFNHSNDYSRFSNQSNLEIQVFQII